MTRQMSSPLAASLRRFRIPKGIPSSRNARGENASASLSWNAYQCFVTSSPWDSDHTMSPSSIFTGIMLSFLVSDFLSWSVPYSRCIVSASPARNLGFRSLASRYASTLLVESGRSAIVKLYSVRSSSRSSGRASIMQDSAVMSRRVPAWLSVWYRCMSLRSPDPSSREPTRIDVWLESRVIVPGSRSASGLVVTACQRSRSPA